MWQENQVFLAASCVLFKEPTSTSIIKNKNIKPVKNNAFYNVSEIMVHVYTYI